MNTAKYVKSNDVLLTGQNGEGVFLHMGTEKYFTLNKVGMLMYNSLIINEPDEKIIEAITDKFDVEPINVRKDFDELVNSLLDANIIEETTS